MSANSVTPFLKLRNVKGEDVYSIDKLNGELLVSQTKRCVDILEPLTLYGEDGDLGTLNLSDIFIDELTNVIDGIDIATKKPKKISDAALECIDTLVKYKVCFRGLSECFPHNNDTYAPPNEKLITAAIELSDEIDGLHLKAMRGHTPPKTPFSRETPKVGANDPCPCGGEDKYKRCCRPKEGDNQC